MLAVAVAAMTWFGQSPASARSDNKSKPVLFVHGYNPTSTNTNCGGDFDWMISTLRSQGFTGSMVKVGYYTNDSYCSMNLHSYGSYGDRDSWRQISKAFSWYVYNTYTRYGIAVDAVGYSMGGLIVRGAIHGSSRGESGFSPPIDVEDAVTLGTPHTGAAWYSNLCLWGQCSALKPGSSDLNWLNTNGNQQGKYGTEWTTFGSNGDWVVPASSAAAMALPSSREYTYSSVPHTGSSNYMHNSTVVTYAGYALGWATW